MGASALVGTTVNLHVRVDGSLPLVHRWLHEGKEIASTTNEYGSEVVAAKAGRYQVVVSNAWGVASSGVSSVVFTNLPPPPNWAPTTLAGRIIEVDVSYATWPFAAPALYRLTFGTGTRNTYSLQGLLSVPNSSGTYTYQRLNGTNGVAVFDDSLTGRSQADLTFTSPTTGTFWLSKPGLSGEAAGNFLFIR